MKPRSLGLLQLLVSLYGVYSFIPKLSSKLSNRYLWKEGSDKGLVASSSSLPSIRLASSPILKATTEGSGKDSMDSSSSSTKTATPPSSPSSNAVDFLSGLAPMLVDFASLRLGQTTGSDTNSTLIGLVQVAQAAMNPRSVTRTFSRQFAKRYLSKWDDKTGLKEIVEQTLADLVRVVDTIDVHTNPKVASFASRVTTQIETLRREHDATVIFFFNESPETISELPSLPTFPLKIAVDDPDESDDEAPPLFGPRSVPAAGAVKKKQEFVRLFKNLITLAKSTEPEADDSWYEDSDSDGGTEGGGAVASTSRTQYAGQSGVDRLLERVKQRMENKVAEERRQEEAVVKAGLRLEFEKWQLLEASRYLSESLGRTKELIGNVSSRAEVKDILAKVPPQLQSFFKDFEATLTKGGLPSPVKIDFSVINSVLESVNIGHRPDEEFPQRDWKSSINVLASQAPLPDPFLDELNHPLYLHSTLLVATTPYTLALTEEVETDPVLLFRTALTASKALGVPTDALKVKHVVSDKACAVMIMVEDRKTTYVAFRGTKDPVDVLTDINFFSATFTPMGWTKEEVDSGFSKGTADFLPFIDPQSASNQIQLMTGTDDQSGVLKVHGGFKVAFDSIKDKVASILEEHETASDNVVFVGHSMGGALAQLATVYFCELKARLVTFASPAIGNLAFCRLLDCCGQPYGGLRVWNEFDVVPAIAQLVGYKHAGVPIKLDVTKSAKEMFEYENVNSLKGLIDLLAPHVLFQLGPAVFVFPVLGWDLQSQSGATLAAAATKAIEASSSASSQEALPPSPPSAPEGAEPQGSPTPSLI